MAYIDKIHCNFYSEYFTFKKWVEKYKPSFLSRFSRIYDSEAIWEETQGEDWNHELSVCYFPYGDWRFRLWLIWRCPIEFIREDLEERGYKTRWYHKLFFKY